MLKPLLHERTRSKIHVFGSDSSAWKAALLAEIPPERIPVCYGGTLADPIDGNPYCSSLVNINFIKCGSGKLKTSKFNWLILNC